MIYILYLLREAPDGPVPPVSLLPAQPPVPADLPDLPQCLRQVILRHSAKTTIGRRRGQRPGHAGQVSQEHQELRGEVSWREGEELQIELMCRSQVGTLRASRQPSTLQRSQIFSDEDSQISEEMGGTWRGPASHSHHIQR